MTRRDAEDWRHRAACLDEDGDLFFAPDGERAPERSWRIAAAKAVCLACPVRGHCLQEARANNIRDGVWGGLDEDERGSGRRRRPQAAPAPQPAPRRKAWKEPTTRPNCGTEAGYQRHTDSSELKCGPCAEWRRRKDRRVTQERAS